MRLVASVPLHFQGQSLTASFPFLALPGSTPPPGFGWMTQALAELKAASPAIMPSLLLCDFGNLGEECARLEAAGVPGLHLDVMDGHFVPNFTYGLTIVEACRQKSELPLDVHLMIDRPGAMIEQFREAGADVLTFHVEAVADPRPVLKQITNCGAAAGLALNPDTPLAQIEEHLDLCDHVLVMSVPAGYGGQRFHPAALEKLQRLRELKPDLVLEVDGGINDDTIAGAVRSGAELLVVGSAIFRHTDYADRVHTLRNLALSASNSA